MVAQSCLTLCDPMDYSLPGSSVRGILQARVLEGAAISFSMGSSLPRDRTWVSRNTGRLYRLSHQGIPLRLRAPQVPVSANPKACSEPVDPIPSHGHRAQAGKSGLVLSDKTRSPFPRSQVLAAGRDHLTGGSIWPPAP